MNIDNFNQLVDEFFRKMMVFFPEERKHLMIYYGKFKAACLLSPQEPANKIVIPLMPYGEHILQRNEDFFKKEEYEKAVQDLCGGINVVKKWDSMKPEVKIALWEYFESIYALGMIVIGNGHIISELKNKCLKA